MLLSYKILWRSSQENPSAGGVERKTGIAKYSAMVDLSDVTSDVPYKRYKIPSRAGLQGNDT